MITLSAVDFGHHDPQTHSTWFITVRVS
jgi:hypothetical protein